MSPCRKFRFRTNAGGSRRTNPIAGLWFHVAEQATVAPRHPLDPTISAVLLTDQHDPAAIDRIAHDLMSVARA
jgi:hypothetical protein